MKTITRDNYYDFLDKTQRSYHASYRALYASDLGGVILDPTLMRIPIDDHMVHRGDGAFEMCKCVGGGIYNLTGHLKRLSATMQALGLVLPDHEKDLTAVICKTVHASGLVDAAIRVYVSRGPGSFGVNPADCPTPHVYVAVSTLSPGFMEQHSAGAKIGLSKIPVKPGYFATMKHCNYLPNVFMKQEAIAQGLDFTIGVDHEGYLAEGPTENIGIITQERALVFPVTDRVLAGTTMERVLLLAQGLVQDGRLISAGYGRLTPQDLLRAAEVIIVGTTTDVTHVCQFEDHQWSGQGSATQELRRLLLEDINHNKAMRTPVVA